jgi:hypothetical protein
MKSVGRFRNLEACRVEVGKIGGWCGKNCVRYASDSYADCAPLVPIERLN